MTKKIQTLLEIAGIQPATADPGRAAVLLIDAQQEYEVGLLPLNGIEKANQGARNLLDAARQTGVPVIHVLHHGKPGSNAFDPKRPFVLPIRGLEPVEGETRIIKSLPNAFAKTELQSILATLSVTDLIIAGYMTHMCVSSTTRAALDLGFRCTVVANATATRDLPAAPGKGIIPAHQVQAAALAALADRFAKIVPDMQAIFGVVGR